MKINYWDWFAFWFVVAATMAVLLGLANGPHQYCADTSVRKCPTGQGGAK